KPTPMKLVEAIIKPHKLEDVKSALTQAGVQGLTVTQVRGFGRQKGHIQRYRGSEYDVDFVPKLKLEVVIADLSLEHVMQAILRSARTGEIGDGKIFIYDLESVIRIRTGEKGEGPSKKPHLMYPVTSPDSVPLHGVRRRPRPRAPGCRIASHSGS